MNPDISIRLTLLLSTDASGNLAMEIVDPDTDYRAKIAVLRFVSADGSIHGGIEFRMTE